MNCFIVYLLHLMFSTCGVIFLFFIFFFFFFHSVLLLQSLSFLRANPFYSYLLPWSHVILLQPLPPFSLPLHFLPHRSSLSTPVFLFTRAQERKNTVMTSASLTPEGPVRTGVPLCCSLADILLLSPCPEHLQSFP